MNKVDRYLLSVSPFACLFVGTVFLGFKHSYFQNYLQDNNNVVLKKVKCGSIT
jgi:hypothetical protein